MCGREKGRRDEEEEEKKEVEKGEREVKHTVLVRISSSPHLVGSRQDHVRAVHCPPHGL